MYRFQDGFEISDNEIGMFYFILGILKLASIFFILRFFLGIALVKTVISLASKLVRVEYVLVSTTPKAVIADELLVIR